MKNILNFLNKNKTNKFVFEERFQIYENNKNFKSQLLQNKMKFPNFYLSNPFLKLNKKFNIC